MDSATRIKSSKLITYGFMKYITHDIITLGKRTVIMPPNINVIEYLTEAIKIKKTLVKL